MDFFNPASGSGHTIAAKPLRMAHIDLQFPTGIARRQKILRLSGRNSIRIACIKRIARLIQGPVLVFSGIGGSRTSPGSSSKAAGNRALGIIVLLIANSADRICLSFLQKEEFKVKYAPYQRSSIQGAIKSKMLCGRTNNIDLPWIRSNSSCFTGPFTNIFMPNKKRNNPEYDGIENKPVSIMPIMSFAGDHRNATTDERSSEGSSKESARWWISGRASTEYMNGSAPNHIFTRSGGNARASKQDNIFSMDKIVFVSRARGSLKPIISFARDHKEASADRHSSEARTDEPVRLWISGLASAKYLSGSAPNLIFARSEGNARASSQDNINSRDETAQISLRPERQRSADGFGGFDKMAQRASEMSRPAFDLALVTNQVYVMLERKIKMERERRGIYGL